MAKKKKRDSQDRRVEPSGNPIQSESASHAVLEKGLQALVLGLVVAAPLVPEGAAEQFFNWILFLLWLLAIAALAVFKLLKQDYTVRVGKLDCCVYGVCCWVAISGIYSLITGTGHARPTINATWQWVGYAAAFFVIRQLCGQRAFRVAAVWGLLCISAGVSLAGLYQRWMVYPELQRQYDSQTEEQKTQAMRQGGINNVEPGSRERIMWENRLKATDPTATFVLANSLAAFLAPWLIIGLIQFRNSWRTKEWIRLALSGLIVLVVATCLVLTNSRTSILATAIGVVGLAVVQFAGQSTRMILKFVIAGILIFVLISTLALITGAVDVQDLGNANKSLLYRIEYWQASGELIREHIWLGCGPGNFQHAYARYQLPQASETVSDPHNFLVEVWAIAGTPAALIMILGGMLWLSVVLRAGREKIDEIDDQASEGMPTKPEELRIQGLLPIGIAVAGVVGLFSAVLGQIGIEMVAIAVISALLLSLLISKFMPADVPHREEVSNRELAVSLGTFVIALSASGGIGFPSVAMTGLILLALSVSQTSHSPIASSATARSAVHRTGKFQQVLLLILLFVSVAAMFAFRGTVYDPIRAAEQQLQLAEMEASNGRLDQAMQKMDLAIQADPYDGNFHFFKLQMAVGKFQFKPADETLDEIEDLAQKSVTSRPNNSKVALESGKLILGLLHSRLNLGQNRRERLEQLSNDLFEVACDRRPNDALHAAFLAFSYAKTGRIEDAAQWADRGLELDQINPHRDKDLSNGPFRVEGYASLRSIEQVLQAIRKKELNKIN